MPGIGLEVNCVEPGKKYRLRIDVSKVAKLVPGQVVLKDRANPTRFFPALGVLFIPTPQAGAGGGNPGPARP
jgi:hypothetical protein